MGDLENQVHDFNPGVKRSGLFWTIPMSTDHFHSNIPAGHSRFHARHQRMPDYHDFFNAVAPGGPSEPGHVSYDVRWTANGAHQRLRDATFGFRGRFTPCDTRISFRVSDDAGEVVYHSLDDGQITVGGVIGHERNGVFF